MSNAMTIDQRIQMVRDDMAGRVPEAMQAREQRLAELLAERKAERMLGGVLAGLEAYAARMARADKLTRKHTAFDSLAEMVATEGYVPTISALTASDRRRRRELAELADAYDGMQETLGDRRRAFRI